MKSNALTFILVMMVSLCCSVAIAQPPAFSSDSGEVMQQLINPTSEPPSPFSHAPDEVLVRFKKNVPPGQIKAVHSRMGAIAVTNYRRIGNLSRVKLFKGRSVRKAVDAYRKDPNVLYAEPNYIIQAQVTPDDTRFSELWAMDNTGQNGGAPDADIDAVEAWDIETGSKDVVVAVIDTGVDYTHSDLADNMFYNSADCNADGIDDDGNGYIDDCHGIDAINNDSDPMDDHYHGTHVAGTIGADGNNGDGVAGVNWDVSIIACKSLDIDGYGTIADAVECLDYISVMKDRGVNIVATNNSWGGGYYSQALVDAIEEHRARGILFVSAAGNYGGNNDSLLFYPCSYDVDNIICVANTDRFDHKNASSNYGKGTVHLLAPGTEILSTAPGDSYMTLSGTSMATPHVTGTTALLFAQDPDRNWREVKNLILSSGDDIAGMESITISGKRLNARQALSCSNSTVFSRLRPLGPSMTSAIGETIVLSALNIDCAMPNGSVSVDIEPTGETVVLLDDGFGLDTAAGDGIYTAGWVPYAEGTFTLHFPDTDSITVDVDPYLQPGFPVKAYHGGGSYHGGPAIHTLVGNIDDDPELEILVTGLATGPLYAWKADGSMVAGWPISESAGAAYPALGDLNVDTAESEVFSGFYGGVLSAYMGNGSILQGWPRNASNYISTPPSLADVDGDGRDEIFIEEESWNLHGYQADGNILPGWPVRGSGGQERHTPAIADLDGDGDLEIVSASGWTTPGVYLHAYHHDGAIVNGFPVLFQISGSDKFPVIGDVDGDGQQEIILAASYTTYILSADGTVENTMATVGSIPYGSAPALADLDGDGFPEIIVQTDTALNVWHGDGSTYPGWPADLGNRWHANSSPVIGDVDGDQLPDIVITTQVPGSGRSGDMRVYDRDGNLHAGFPKILNIGPGAVPAIADIDLDGRNEIIISGSYWDGHSGYYDKVWVFDLGGPPHGAVLWGQFMGGGRHQGTYQPTSSPLPVNATLLVLKSGTGSGTITSIPAGIDCGIDCIETFAAENGTTVTLNATAAQGSEFTGWSGACAGQGNPCNLTMDTDQTTTAFFEPLYFLSVSLDGSGSGAVTSAPAGIDCGSDCDEPYVNGTIVTLNATAASGSEFIGWSGACAGQGNPCNLTMDTDLTTAAVFEPLYLLSVSIDGPGSGTVTSAPAGIDCGSDCSETYISATAVTLTAFPAANSVFDIWSGACAGQGNPCEVILDADTHISATFGLAQADLSLSMTAVPDPARVNNDLIYTIHVINNGPNGADGVNVHDILPADTVFVSASASQGSCGGVSEIVCDLGALDAADTATMTLIVKPTKVTKDLSNSAEVTSSTADPNTINNSATVTIRVKGGKRGN